MLGNLQGMSNFQTGQAWSGLTRTNKLNINPVERLLSLLGGSLMVLYGLSRFSFSGVGTAMAGGYLIYRGLTGYCLVYESLNINTAGSANRLQFDELSQEVPDTTTDDMEDEKVWQTFPASDPPSSW